MINMSEYSNTFQTNVETNLILPKLKHYEIWVSVKAIARTWGLCPSNTAVCWGTISFDGTQLEQGASSCLPAIPREAGSHAQGRTQGRQHQGQPEAAPLLSNVLGRYYWELQHFRLLVPRGNPVLGMDSLRLHMTQVHTHPPGPQLTHGCLLLPHAHHSPRAPPQHIAPPQGRAMIVCASWPPNMRKSYHVCCLPSPKWRRFLTVLFSGA